MFLHLKLVRRSLGKIKVNEILMKLQKHYIWKWDVPLIDTFQTIYEILR